MLVGYGRVGSLVGGRSQAPARRFLVIEDDQDAVERRERGHRGDRTATPPTRRCSQAANLAAARCLLVAIPDAFEGGQIVEQARRINPQLRSSRARIRTPRSSI